MVNLRLHQLFQQPGLGVCYYPEHCSEKKWEQDIATMKKIGLNWVRMGEFAWSRIERERNQFDFKWVKKILNLCLQAELKVIWGTPTATPPKWLIDESSDILGVDQEGRIRKFGSRRHYCFSSLKYRQEAKRIVTIILEQISQHPAIEMWQVDNEFGCHNTTFSYSNQAKIEFRKWLKKKYKRIEQLNQRWGNVFWSMEYNDFNQIELPNLNVAEPNPSLVLDFFRFSSEQVISFNQLQVDLIRKYNPSVLITHNFMGTNFDFDHFQLASNLDLASWDSYPLGFLQTFFQDQQHQEKYARVGDPDFQALHHDLYRSLNGNFIIMEQQPGAVNWAKYNFSPNESTIRMWVWEAIAHQALLVSFFRFRQVPYAQEQMHEALLLPHDQPNKAYRVTKLVGKEIKQLNFKSRQPLAEVGIVFDYPTYWSWTIQPQGLKLDFFQLIFSWYRAFRKRGINLDFIRPDFSNYQDHKIIVLSGLTFFNPAYKELLKNKQTYFILGPKTASKTSDFQIPPNLPPQYLQDLLPIQVIGVETLGVTKVPVFLSKPTPNLAFEKWREFITTDDTQLEVLAYTIDQQVAWVEKNNLSYLAGYPNDLFLDTVVSHAFEKVKLRTYHMEEGLRMYKDSRYWFFFNYSNQDIDLKEKIGFKKILLGNVVLNPSGITVVEL